MKLAEMARTGHLLSQLRELAEAGYEVPEEFTRGAEDPPRDHRIRLFFERYDLGKHFPSDGDEYPKECKTRKLSDDELRQRREHADAVRTASQKKQPPPLPPWVTPGPNLEVQKLLSEGLTAFRQQQAAEQAERVRMLKGDEQLGRKLQEARETWVNLPPRHSAHTQHVREGYGNAVPEFEEDE
ncbi:hypothetical protein [Streptomyces cyaneofuscatus]